MTAFEDMLAHARGDERIVGVVLGGSRGKGFEVEGSDWDVYLIVTDEGPSEGIDAALARLPPEIEICAVLTMSAFADYATPDRPEEWDRYNFAHVQPVFDRTSGELARQCAAKEWLPPDVAAVRAAAQLDAYINSTYRAVKNARNGQRDAAALDAAESVSHLLDFAFTAERRVRPYNKYLAWELGIHPLQHPWWSHGSSDPLSVLLSITRVDVQASAQTFTSVEQAARRAGFSAVLDAWGHTALTSMRGS